MNDKNTLRSPAWLLWGLAPLAILLLLVLFFIGYADTTKSSTISVKEDRQFTILAINDVYRAAGLYGGSLGGLARVRALRLELEARTNGPVMLLHGGDALFPSLLSRKYRGEQMVDLMNLLDGRESQPDEFMFAVLGNHEFDGDGGNLQARIEQSEFTWLNGNVIFGRTANNRSMIDNENLIAATVIEINNIKVGLFGVTGNFTTADYIDQYANPIEAARVLSADLRDQGAEVVIGLTHLSQKEDEDILKSLCGVGPDFIVGGHEHEQYLGNVACGADGSLRHLTKSTADAASASIITVKLLEGEKEPLVEIIHRRLEGDDPVPDLQLTQKANDWVKKHAEWFCSTQFESPRASDCLDEEIGRTDVTLIAEEIKIRSEETNYGNWVADQMLKLYPDVAECSGQPKVAFINSGSLRLNQDIPAGEITRRNLEQLIAYDNKVLLLKIPGEALQEVAAHAISSPGEGNWLQIAGMSFRYRGDTIESLRTYDDSGQLSEVISTNYYCVVTTDFLVDPSIGNQDGFNMLGLDQQVERPNAPRSLKVVLELALARTLLTGAGIQQEFEGRICNAENADISESQSLICNR